MQNLTWKHIVAKKRLKLANMFMYYSKMDKPMTSYDQSSNINAESDMKICCFERLKLANMFMYYLQMDKTNDI